VLEAKVRGTEKGIKILSSSTELLILIEVATL
jgi:hypothetical protein